MPRRMRSAPTIWAHRFEDIGAVEEGGSGGVEVDVFHATENLGHEGVEGEAATPVGADDFVVGEVLDEGPELVGGGFALAGVVVSDGFGAMDQDYEVQSAGDVHEGGHFAGIGDVEVLGVGVEFADAAGTPGGAAFYFQHGVLSPGGVDGAEGG